MTLQRTQSEINLPFHHGHAEGAKHLDLT